MTPLAAPTRPASSVPRRSPPARESAGRRLALAAVLVTSGTVGVGAGAGAGIRHAQKTGLSATSVLGVLALLAGLVLLAAGIRRVWRLAGWWRLLVPPVVVAALLTASCVGLATAYTQVPATTSGEGTPAASGLAFEEVGYVTADGARLSAWLVPPRNGAAVVLRHGAGSTRTATLRHAAVLAGRGFGVLMTDARGHGRSAGTGMDLGWFGDADVEASVQLLQDRLGLARERIGLVGLSMGGEEAVGAAAATGVRAVVAEGATARTAQDKDQWLPHGPAGAVQRVLDRITFALTDVLTPASRPTSLREAVRTAQGTRFLLVTAGEEPDEARAARVLEASAPSRVDVWTVPRAGHTGGLAEDPTGWERHVVGFLEGQLL